MPSDSSQPDRPRRSRWDALVIEPLQRQLAEHARILRPGMRLTIGSAPDADVRLNLQAVEPIHCVLVTDLRGVYLERWNDRTWWNDKPLDLAPRSPHCDLPELSSGDRLAIGPIEFRLRRPEPEDWLIERNREQSERLRASLANLGAILTWPAGAVAPSGPAEDSESTTSAAGNDEQDAEQRADTGSVPGVVESVQAPDPLEVAATTNSAPSTDVADSPVVPPSSEEEGGAGVEHRTAAECRATPEDSATAETESADAACDAADSAAPLDRSDTTRAAASAGAAPSGLPARAAGGCAPEPHAASGPNEDVFAEPVPVGTQSGVSGACGPAAGAAERSADTRSIDQTMADEGAQRTAVTDEALRRAIRDLEEDRRRLSRAEADLARELEELQRRRSLLQREWEALHAERRALEQERSEVATARAELLRLKRELQQQWGTCEAPMARWQAVQAQEVRLREREQELNRREAALAIAGQRLLQAPPLEDFAGRPSESDAAGEPPSDAETSGPSRGREAAGPGADGEEPAAVGVQKGNAEPSSGAAAGRAEIRLDASRLAEWLRRIDNVLGELATTGLELGHDDKPLADKPLADKPLADKPLADKPLADAEHAAPAAREEPSAETEMPAATADACDSRAEETGAATVTVEVHDRDVAEQCEEEAEDVEVPENPAGHSDSDRAEVRQSEPMAVRRLAGSVPAEEDSLLMRLEGNIRELLGLTAHVQQTGSTEQPSAGDHEVKRPAGADTGVACQGHSQPAAAAAEEPGAAAEGADSEDAADANEGSETDKRACETDIDAWLEALDGESRTPAEAVASASASVLDDAEPTTAEEPASEGGRPAVTAAARATMVAERSSDLVEVPGAETPPPEGDARRRSTGGDRRQKRRRLLLRGWWNLLAAAVSFLLVWVSLERPLTPDDTTLRWLAGVFGALSLLEAVQSFSAGVRPLREQAKNGGGRSARHGQEQA